MRALAIALLFVGACDLGEPERASSPKAPRAADTEPPEIDDVPRQDNTSRGHIGVIAASESVDVPSTIEGIIATVVVGIGDSVKAGDALAKIDERPMLEELKIAKASQRAARAQTRREYARARAARDVHRRQKSLGGEVISKAQVAASKSAAAEASAASASASASADAEATRVARLERMLGETTISAPFDGKISVRYVGPGESVVRGTPVVRLISSDELRVDFVIPLADKAKYAIGDEIKILLEGSDKPIKGIVRRIAPDLDPVAQMVTAQAELVLADGQRDIVQAGLGVWVSPAKSKEPEQLN